MIAPLAGVTMVSRPFLVQSVGLADGGIEVDSQGCVAGSGPSRPRPGPATRGSPGPVGGTWPQRKLRRKVPSVDGALDQAVENTGRPTGSQRIGVVNAVAASQRGGDQRHYLVAGVGPARRITHVQALLYQLGKTEVQGQGGWEEQAGIGHQAVIIEAILMRSG